MKAIDYCRRQLFIANFADMDLIGNAMTKKTKEAIKTTAAIVIAMLAIVMLWIYPLNQAGKIIVRPNQQRQPSGVEEYGLPADSLTVTTEDNLKLSGLFFAADSARGTVILIHGLFGENNSQLSKVRAFVDEGFNAVVYDQRGYGKSDGKYRSGGYFEANDLQSVISRLDLEDRLIHPVIVWGEDHGATAAISAWAQENRIDFVIAENPVVNGRDWQKRVIEYKNLSAPNLCLPVIWWWMKQKSGYEIPIDDTDISDYFATAVEKKPGRMLSIACGDADKAVNRYLDELMPLGGQWLVLPCSDGNLFEKHKDRLMSAVMEMVQTGRSLESREL
jgi:pimeloyl-ACP methyl ester carboxylesterase